MQIEGGEPVETDLVVVSVGRRPLSESLGLDGTGVEVDERGFVKVDERCRTSVEGVWAIGDLVATPALAHVGFAEAIVAIKDILGEDPVPVDYDRVPLVHLLLARGRLRRATPSRRPRTPATTSSPTARSTAHNARSMIVNQPEGLVKVIAEKQARRQGGPGARRAHGRPVGHRAARAGLPGRQLGGHRRRGRPLHPAPPDDDARSSARRSSPSPGAPCTAEHG